MALSKYSGSLTRNSGVRKYEKQTQPSKNSNKYTDPKKQIILSDKDYSEQLHVKDTFANRTALDPVRSASITSSILAFPDGVIVDVIYYTRYYRENLMTYGSSAIGDSNPIHSQYQKINNFKLVLTKEMEYGYHANEDNRSGMSGEALIYPGFNPRIDDMFIYEIEIGQIGIFKIASVERLSLHSESYHKVTFYLNEHMNEINHAEINKSVTSVVYYNLDAYFGDTTVLLSHESYINLSEILEMRDKLIAYYHKEFYDNTLQTYFNKEDNYYDPYIIEFLSNTLDMYDVASVPATLVYPLHDYDRSFWSALQNKDLDSLQDCTVSFAIKKYSPDIMSVVKTGLLNKQYLVLDKDSQNPYLLKKEFYNSLYTSSYSKDIEYIIYSLYKDNVFNAQILLENLYGFRKWSNIDKFNNIPIYMFILKDIAMLLNKGAN